MTKPTPRQVIEAAGYVYLGEQPKPRGAEPGHLFNVGDRTFMIDNPVTAEALAAKMEARRLAEEAK